MTRSALRLVTLLVLAGAFALVGGCATKQEAAGDGARPSVSSSAASSSPAATASTPATVIPPRPHYSDPHFFIEEVDDAVADAIGRRFVYDAVASTQVPSEVMVRVFRDAPPDEVIVEAAAPGITAVESPLENWTAGAVTVDVVRCPFTATQWETVDVYLRSLEWRDTGKDTSGIPGSPRLWPDGFPLHLFVHCQVSFAVWDISMSEIQQIRTVALANDIAWIEFATGTHWALIDQPRDLPSGFLARFELPWY